MGTNVLKSRSNGEKNGKILIEKAQIGMKMGEMSGKIEGKCSNWMKNMEKVKKGSNGRENGVKKWKCLTFFLWKNGEEK